VGEIVVVTGTVEGSGGQQARLGMTAWRYLIIVD